ncbi:MAG: ribosomal protein S18-alanine N-acetyltransferase [Gammaproteobacteria bacterium]|nr:ribosomal protein S18-alanine N-acetyltransferase [Gammaproteobacteria bacterium]MBP9729664.1 ribosomal protein S18-alanine N-acetyltransferase [Gammaproteobacteria bacterium]
MHSRDAETFTIPMIQLRPMYYEDLPGVLAIEETLSVCPWTYTIFQDCLRVGYSCWVYAETNAASTENLLPDHIVGYGLLSVAAEEGHILNLCIEPAKQNQGLGTRMLQHLLAEAKKLGAKSVLLEVRLSNEGAYALYQRFGFAVIGHRKDYYELPHGREDGLVLEFVF